MTANSRRCRQIGCGLVLALTLIATTAAAQSDDSSGSRRHQRRNEGTSGQPQKKKAPLPEMKITPEPWPRLDPGAVFCRTADDLRQHLALVAARLDGIGSPAGEPPGCRLIRAQTAVTVLAREGPAQTRVRISEAPAETGWTDAFLPEKKAGP